MLKPASSRSELRSRGRRNGRGRLLPGLILEALPDLKAGFRIHRTDGVNCQRVDHRRQIGRYFRSREFGYVFDDPGPSLPRRLAPLINRDERGDDRVKRRADLKKQRPAGRNHWYIKRAPATISSPIACDLDGGFVKVRRHPKRTHGALDSRRLDSERFYKNNHLHVFPPFRCPS